MKVALTACVNSIKTLCVQSTKHGRKPTDFRRNLSSVKLEPKKKRLSYIEAGPKSGVPIVFLHAFPLNKRMWDSQVDYLAKQGARCISVDLPGFGDSDSLRSDIGHIRDYSEEVFNFLDSIFVKKAVFAGCSFGGYTVFDMWKLSPERIRAMMLYGTHNHADTEEQKEGRFKLIERVKSEGTGFLPEVLLPKMFSEKQKELKKDKVKQVSEWMVNSNKEAVIHASTAMANRSETKLATVSVPVLVTCGSEDPLTGEKIMKPMKDNIRVAQFALIRDGGHLSPFDSPDEVNSTALTFLQTHKLL